VILPMNRLLSLLAVLLFCAGLFCLAQAPSRAAGWLPLVKGSGGTEWCGLIPAQGNLLNCWPYDTAHSTSSTVTDVTGGKNASMSNFSLNGSGPTGSPNLNNAGSFNGSSTIGTTSLPGLPLTGPYTLAMWIKTAGTSGFPVPMTNDANTTASNNGFQVRLNTGSTSAPDLFTGYGSGFNTVGYNGGNYTAGSWNLLVWTFDGSTTMIPYVNATSNGSFTINGSFTSGSTNVTFGYAPGYGGYYNGLLAGVGIWNVVLTSTQITTLNGL
jgi:hypothetical protein